MYSKIDSNYLMSLHFYIPWQLSYKNWDYELLDHLPFSKVTNISACCLSQKQLPSACVAFLTEVTTH